MAQNDPTIENQTMPNARTDINNSFQSFLTQHRGTGRPSYAVASTIWVDSDTPGSNVVTLNYFDGTDDIAIGTIDESGNTFTATNHVKTNVTPSFTVAVNEAASVDVASASTTDIGAAASNNVKITGTTTITSLGTAAAGITRDVRFAAALTLTHNATSLILPTAANITTAADDTAEFLSLGSGNWFCQRYNRKSGEPLTAAASQTMPSGSVVCYGGTTEPSGWLFCYGQAVSRATYSALFTAIGTTYGSGDGSTTFNLPDIRGRVVAGQDDMGGVSANRLTAAVAESLNGDTLGATGGAETHTLTAAQMPSHTHDITVKSSGTPGTSRPPALEQAATTTTYATGSAGSSSAHNNVQPTIILNYIIKT